MDLPDPIPVPEPPERYTTLAAEGRGDYREKGSKFLARAWLVTDEAAIDAALDALKGEHPKARHVCTAWRLGLDGSRWRANDDQEPSGSAGRPMLGRIDHHGLTDVLVAVVRYFGGTKLGVPGLIHAYRTAAEEALLDGGFREVEVLAEGRVRAPNARIGDVEGLLARHRATVDERTYGERAGFVFRVPQAERDALEAALRERDSRCAPEWTGPSAEGRAPA